MTVDCGSHQVGLVHAQSPVDDWAEIQEAVYSEQLAIDCTWPWDRAQGPERSIANISMVVSGHIGTNQIVSQGNQRWIDTLEASGELTLVPLNDLLDSTQSSKFGR